MGILNVTPDSFSDGGRFLDPGAAVARGLQMVAEGADLLDIGGESTRPGATPVGEEEELRRVLPVITRLVKRVTTPLSIDTAKSGVAARALDAGASLVNDVTALGDPRMGPVVARHRAALILMHMRGTPRTMQRAPRYRDVVGDVMRFLHEAVRRAQQTGVARQRLLIDPGLGFGKTVRHNLELLRALPRFVRLGLPVVLGASRKSFMGAVLGAELSERLPGSLACAAHAFICGVQVVRVHDVKPTRQLLTMLEAIRSAGVC